MMEIPLLIVLRYIVLLFVISGYARKLATAGSLLLGSATLFSLKPEAEYVKRVRLFVFYAGIC